MQYEWRHVPPNIPIERRVFGGGDAGGGRYWYWGGAHKGYTGSNTDAFDIDTETWGTLDSVWLWGEADTWDPSLVYHVASDGTLTEESPISAETLEAISGSLGGGGPNLALLTPDKQPYVVHTYQQIAYWAGAMWLLHWPIGLMRFDPVTKVWTIETPANDSPPLKDINHHCLIRDDKRNGLIAVRGNGYRDVWLYDGAVWTKHMDLPTASWGDVHFAHDPVNDLLFGSYSKDGFVVVDLTNQTVRWVTVPLGIQAHEYESETGKFLAFTKASETGTEPVSVYRFDPVDDSSALLDVPGGPPIGRIRYDLLDRDDVTGKYLMPDFPGSAGSTGAIDGVWFFEPVVADTTSEPETESSFTLVQRALPTPELFPEKGGYKDARMVTRQGKIYLLGGDWGEYLADGTPEESSRGMNSIFGYDPAADSWWEESGRCPDCSIVPHRPDEVPVCYDSKRDRIWLIHGFFHGLGKIGDTDFCPNGIEDTMYYDLATKRWYATGLGRIYVSDVGFVVYDPVTDKIIGPAPNNPDEMFELDPKTLAHRIWTPPKDGADAPFRAWTEWVDIDVEGRRIYMMDRAEGPSIVWVYHIDEDRLENIGPAPEDTPRGNVWLLQWVPDIGKLFVMLAERVNPEHKFHLYDPATGMWETHIPAVEKYMEGEVAVGGNMIGRSGNTIVLIGARGTLDRFGHMLTYFWTLDLS